MAVIAPIDVEWGNASPEQAERMRRASSVVIDDHVPGATEPWIVELLCALLKATGVENPIVFESGGFLGTTTVHLARTLQWMGGGRLIVSEIDPDRAQAIQDKMLPFPGVTVLGQDAIQVIRSLPDGQVTFAFIDDDHDPSHVSRETELLLPKMRSGGFITFHDVFGRCDLQQVVRRYGGYCIDTPRAGPAGGLGIIQC